MPKRPPKSSRSPKSKRKRAAAADTLATGTDALTALRGRIDAVDAEIQRLIAERAQFAKEIGIVKGLTSTVEYYRPEREAHPLHQLLVGERHHVVQQLAKNAEGEIEGHARGHPLGEGCGALSDHARAGAP